MRTLTTTIMIVENEDIPFKEKVCLNIQNEDIHQTNLIHIYNFIMNENIIDYNFIKCNIFFYNLDEFIKNQNIGCYMMDTYISQINTDNLLLLIQIT